MAPIPESARTMLESAEYVWITTVRADGMPQPTPVWFLLEGDEVLIYSMPHAQKVRNLRANPHVALSFTGQEDAESFVVIQGVARLVEEPAPLPQAYLDKYLGPMAEIDFTPEIIQRDFSTRIYVTATHVRVQ